MCNPNEILRPLVNQDDPTMLAIDDAVLPLDSLISKKSSGRRYHFGPGQSPSLLKEKHYFPLLCSLDNIIVRHLWNILLAFVNISYRSFLQSTTYLRFEIQIQQIRLL